MSNQTILEKGVIVSVTFLCILCLRKINSKSPGNTKSIVVLKKYLLVPKYAVGNHLIIIWATFWSLSTLFLWKSTLHPGHHYFGCRRNPFPFKKCTKLSWSISHNSYFYHSASLVTYMLILCHYNEKCISCAFSPINGAEEFTAFGFPEVDHVLMRH